MVEKTTGIRLRTALFRWTLASIIIWLAFNGLSVAFQTAVVGFRHGFGSEEIGTPFEALLFRVVGIIVFDVKYIIFTVLLWGLLYHFVKSINKTWRNMTLSIALIFFIVATLFLFISKNMIEKAVIINNGVFIYLSLLVPRIIFSKLKPGNIL